MLPFLKPKQSGAVIGAGMLQSIAQRYAAEFPESHVLEGLDARIDATAVRQEWLYFQIFLTDFAVYNALGRKAAKANILTPFWADIKEWLSAVEVAELPERFAIVGGGPRTLPSETKESAFSRLTRRIDDYAAAVTNPQPQGLNWSVSTVFAANCGFMELTSITGVAAYFSSMLISISEMLKDVTITP
jgi:hypothetical protein